MKFNNIIKIFALPLVALVAVGCKSDYLDLAPETTVSAGDVIATTDAAQLAINGICKSMNCQYSELAEINQMYNGELNMAITYNDALGPDYVTGLATSTFGEEWVTGEAWFNDAGYLNSMPWRYAYNLINQANVILGGIDDAEGSEDDRNFVKGEALTFRAFGYLKVLMYFAPRWQDSENGNVYVAPLRLTQGTDPCPLSTMNDILDQCYKDLDEAIECFNNSSTKRTYKWMPDISVAQGVYARIALIKNDWATAQKMAHDARQGYQVMDNDTYLSGFYKDNNDFMWIADNADSGMYYFSFGSKYAANGNYTYKWGIGAGAISIDLYNQLDPNDIRRVCYLTPDKINVLPKQWNPGKITEAEFWNPFLVNTSSTMNVASGPYNKEMAEKLLSEDKTGKYDGKWGTYNIALRYGQYYMQMVYKGDVDEVTLIDEKDGSEFVAYYKSALKGNIQIAPGKKATMVCTPFGAHYKFMSIPPYGTGSFSFMRASEMALTEAEAAYHNGDEATAKSIMTEINGKRITGYVQKTSGQDLLDEIRLTRRIELWGEGHNYTDFKRWNLPFERRAWKEYDPTSGNFPPEQETNLQPSACNGFVMMVPAVEYRYNSAIDLSLLPYYKK